MTGASKLLASGEHDPVDWNTLCNPTSLFEHAGDGTQDEVAILESSLDAIDEVLELDMKAELQPKPEEREHHLPFALRVLRDHANTVAAVLLFTALIAAAITLRATNQHGCASGRLCVPLRAVSRASQLSHQPPARRAL